MLKLLGKLLEYSVDFFVFRTTAAEIASSIVAKCQLESVHQNAGGTQSNSSIKLCRRRKARTVFSDQQLSVLEKRFESQKYLSTPERVDLANSLGLSETQVVKIFTWEGRFYLGLISYEEKILKY